MNRWISNTKYIIFGLFFVASATATAYEWWFVWPAQKCDKAAAWWDPEDHQCLSPMPIRRITGRDTAAATAPAADAAPITPKD